jgi:fatty acid desaturase
MFAMNSLDRKTTISWYRSPVTRETLDKLNQRSDLQGFIQTFGHLGLLALTGVAAAYSAGRWPFPIVLLLVLLHGTFYAFLLNGFHEFVHKTVFRTKWLNTLFLYVFSFLGSFNPVLFWASHQD